MKPKTKKVLISILTIILLIFITIISIKILNKKELLIDNLAYNLFVKKLRNPILTPIMKLIAIISNTTATVIIVILLMLIIKNKKIALTIPINLIIATTINHILKIIFKRPRPIGYRLIKINEYSFPSGHAMISMALYGLLIYLIYIKIKDKKLKKILIIISVFMIAIIGASRIYLGVHYCSDVLVGYSISFIYLIAYIQILNKYKILS